ncbi:MAG: hypothetical protein MKZ85_00975 [Pedosphaera sp.]|nr:hypothetical protein [Pedosphaera sp.]
MKHLLLTTIAALLVVGCATTQKPEPKTTKAPDISIHDTVSEGSSKAIKQRLEAGTDVNAKDDYGTTPLHQVTTKEIAQLLIAKDADVNAKNKGGFMTIRFP